MRFNSCSAKECWSQPIRRSGPCWTLGSAMSTQTPPFLGSGVDLQADLQDVGVHAESRSDFLQLIVGDRIQTIAPERPAASEVCFSCQVPALASRSRSYSPLRPFRASPFCQNNEIHSWACRRSFSVPPFSSTSPSWVRTNCARPNVAINSSCGLSDSAARFDVIWSIYALRWDKYRARLRMGRSPRVAFITGIRS